MDYSIGFAETYEILKYMDKKTLSKIPKDVFDIIKNNKTNNYIFNYNKELSLIEQNVHKETIEILSYLYYYYLSDEDSKKRLSKIYNDNIIELENEKKFKYGNTIFNNK